MAKHIPFLLTLFLMSWIQPSVATTATPSSTNWHYVNDAGELKIKLYFFGQKLVHTAKPRTHLLTAYPCNTRGLRWSSI